MSKKYTCAGMNTGGRVKGYADGGAVDEVSAQRRMPETPRAHNPQRSESVEHETARRDLRRTPAVTIAEDFVGGFSESKAQSNAVRTAIREGADHKMKAAGGDYDSQRRERRY